MSLFSQLLDEVADANNYPLDNCLLRAKLLASRLPGRKFRQWVDAELDGYRGGMTVPDYRVIPAQLFGDFADPWGRAIVRNSKLSIVGWEEENRNCFENYSLPDNIGVLLEAHAADANVFRHRLDISFVQAYRESGNAQVSGMILQEAERIFTKASLRGGLLAIRSRLLDFLIELRERHPELDESDAAAAKIPEEEISRIAEHTIYQGCQVVNVGGNISTGGNFTTAGSIGAGSR